MSDLRPTRDLTGTIVRGSLWLFGASSLLAVTSFLANWALGAWLSRGDFGVYALAISFSTLIQVFRDGGVQYWLARQNDNQVRVHQAAAFGLTMASSVVVGLLLVWMGPVLGHLYQNRDVARLVILLGLSTPLQSLSIVSDAGLQVQMRFRDLSMIRGLVGCTRYLLTVLLAYFGYGPYSFIYPIFVVAVLQAACSFALTGMRPWTFRPTWMAILHILGSSRWAMMGTFATALLQQVDYVTLGVIATKDRQGIALVGTYFFAFMLAMQPSTLLGQSVRKVFVPAFASAGSSVARRERGALSAVTLLGLLVSPLLLWFTLSAAEIVKLLWGDKWDTAIPAIQCLAIVVPIHLMVDVSRMITQADGRFRVWTTGVLLRGATMILAVLIAGMLGGRDDVTIVAATVAVFIAIGGLIESTLLFRFADLSVRLVLHDFLLPYAVSCLAAFVTWMLYGHLPASLERLGAMTTTFLAFYVITAVLLFRQAFAHVLSLGLRLSRHRQQPAAPVPSVHDSAIHPPASPAMSVSAAEPIAEVEFHEGTC